MSRCNVTVVGSGAFGTAVACVIARAGRHSATLLTRKASIVADFRMHHRNDAHLPGINLPASMAVTDDPTCLIRSQVIVIAVPAQRVAETLDTISSHVSTSASIVVCAKGIDRTSGSLLTDLVSRAMTTQTVAVLSGPGFAADMADDRPVAMTLACQEIVGAHRLVDTLSGKRFRLYPSYDVVGVQLGGALKNVLAIACGIVEGAGYGDSAKAALIARGLAEMSRLVVARGGNAATVSGLSGLGDLVLTATSHQSRNLCYGIKVGKGGSNMQPSEELVEGALTAGIASDLARKFGVSMPIVDAVSQIISGRLDVAGAMMQFMSRPITTE